MKKYVPAKARHVASPKNEHMRSGRRPTLSTRVDAPIPEIKVYDLKLIEDP